MSLTKEEKEDIEYLHGLLSSALKVGGQETPTTRTSIREKIHMYNDMLANVTNDELVKAIQNQILELEREDLMFSDEEQWYVEREIEIVLSKTPYVSEKRKCGYVYWIGDFIDERTGKPIKSEQYKVVKINGNWV